MINIRGMFCRHCETTVSEALMGLEGVRSVTASFEKGQAEVVYDPQTVSVETLKKRIEQAGYETDEPGSFRKITAILVILSAVYITAKLFGWTKIFDFFPTADTTVSLGMLFMIGLLTGVHCIAMCGGINLTQSVISSENRENPLRPNLLYNTGRVISYTLTGALCGGIGSTLSLSGTLRGIIPIIAGILMIIMALRMLGVFKILRKIRFPSPSRFNFKLRQVIGKHTGRSSFLIGLANGLMPCGPLQSMQIYALAAGSIFKGAVSMFLFSLGTVPLMFGFGFFAGKINLKYRKTMLTVSAVLVFLMGINMAVNGLSLSGITVSAPVREQADVPLAEEDIQKVRTEIDYGRYPAFTVRKGIPVEWDIFVPEGKLTGCNGEIIVPAYGIDIKLQEGTNIVRFTPEEAGVIPYSCWMGMIRSTITVIE